MKNCICYQFDPKCWAASGKIWTRHLKDCRRCRQWASRDCKVRLHLATDKGKILDEVSNSKVTLSGKIKDRNGRLCCENGHCTHRFYSHKAQEVPWWTCYNNIFCPILKMFAYPPAAFGTAVVEFRTSQGKRTSRRQRRLRTSGGQ